MSGMNVVIQHIAQAMIRGDVDGAVRALIFVNPDDEDEWERLWAGLESAMGHDLHQALRTAEMAELDRRGVKMPPDWRGQWARASKKDGAS